MIRRMYHPLSFGLSNVPFLVDGVTRSISPENPRGEKGAGAREIPPPGRGPAAHLGKGWKVRPCVTMPAGSTLTLAEIDGPGVIQHIWITVDPRAYRDSILRMYWDGEASPSVETPLGDFFCNGWGERCNINSLPIVVNPAGGFNSYWQMPFRKSARITLQNLLPKEARSFYYQIDYTLTRIPEDMAYFHAQWRRSNPLPYQQVHTLLDGVRGQGHYVGTYLAWGVNNNGWWGEGEIKFYLDGDKEFPTICGTGTEDYFCGSYDFEYPRGAGYCEFSGPYAGLPQVIRPNQLYDSQMRFGLYRWHIMDPVRFQKDLRVTMQALGWRSGGRYLPNQDDIASVAFWYQTLPTAPFPQLPDKDYLEVI